jgi:very-short-patch-repair endonuclease
MSWKICAPNAVTATPKNITAAESPSLPKIGSPGEEEFALHCRIYHIEVEREYRFHDTRHWRFDFAIPDKKIGIEIEGGSWTRGRHNRGGGFEQDCVKYNTAVLLGWRVLRFTTGMVSSGRAIADTRALLGVTFSG